MPIINAKHHTLYMDMSKICPSYIGQSGDQKTRNINIPKSKNTLDKFLNHWYYVYIRYKGINKNEPKTKIQYPPNSRHDYFCGHNNKPCPEYNWLVTILWGIPMIRRGVGKETITEDGFEVFAFLLIKRCLKCREDVIPGNECEHVNCNVDTLTQDLLNIINERKGGEN